VTNLRRQAELATHKARQDDARKVLEGTLESSVHLIAFFRVQDVVIKGVPERKIELKVLRSWPKGWPHADNPVAIRMLKDDFAQVMAAANAAEKTAGADEDPVAEQPTLPADAAIDVTCSEEDEEPEDGQPEPDQ